MKNKAICPKCLKPSQLTLIAANGRVLLWCGACGQWWSIGEIEHTPYFFGGPAEDNGPNRLNTCATANCSNPVFYGKFCEGHSDDGRLDG